MALVFFCVLQACAVAAMAADIASYDQARDRLVAQVVGDRTDVLEILGNPAGLTGPVDVVAGDETLRLGRGPGWLFAVRLDAGKNPLFLVAFVGQGASVDVQEAKAAPPGLSPLPRLGAPRTAAAVTSRDAAFAVLTAELLGHSTVGRRVHVATAKVEGPSVAVPTWKETVTLSGGPGWLFFVDDAPRANWAHACRYVLVSEDGALAVHKAQTPPSDMSAFTELTTWPAAKASLPVTRRGAPGSLRQSTPAANRYAVIISGGWNQWSNYPRYWNDCAFFYNTLMHYGFLKDHVTVLFADGTDPAVDRSDGISSPLDFDGDNLPDINYSATKANIALVFNQLAANLGANDLLYIFTTDHGSAQDGNVYPYAVPSVTLNLWGEEITGDELAAEVDKVTAKAVVGIFEQCFSGGLVETLAGANRVVMSASRWWELSYAMGPDYEYDEFSYYVTTALADPKQGDTNGDGMVTMEEAYLFALRHDSNQSESLDSTLDNLGEHPSYISTPWDLGRTLSLGGSEPTARPPVLAGYSQFQTAEDFPTPDPSAAKGWHGDDATWTHTLPFVFPLAGQSYSSVSVSSNGVLFFGDPSTSGKNSINALSAAIAIAPQWDDLTTADSQSDIFVTDTAGHTTIVWAGLTYVDQQAVNMAVRLYPDGNFTLYYDTGNNLTTRLPMRDKTIGVSAGGGLHPALHNGMAMLSMAPAVAFRRATAPWAVPPATLLLSE
ncbi:MAG: C13 family peptidase [Desulfovibrionaceae bacterium]|nr:C13 family peptidase [Desulfovibrionaceae bacterium]